MRDLHSNAACRVESVLLGIRVQDALLTENDNLETQREREAGTKDGNPAMDMAQ